MELYEQDVHNVCNSNSKIKVYRYTNLPVILPVNNSVVLVYANSKLYEAIVLFTFDRKCLSPKLDTCLG